MTYHYPAGPLNIFPCLYYRDALNAIDWLSRVFGFEQRMIVHGPPGTVAHAELSLAGGVVFVASVRPESGLLSPLDLFGVSQALSVYVEDPDAHFVRAKALGARIVQELRVEEFGSRGYAAKDIEGNHWYFGTYRPGAFWHQP